MQLLCNRYFEVLIDHKAIEYMIKSKTEFPTTRLKTLLLKLSEYTFDLKYQKDLEMHTSNTLSRLQNIADMPDNCKAQPCRASLGYPFHNTAAHMEATPTREGI